MVDDTLWQAVVRHLPSYLDRQRWYADKLRPIESLELVDAAVIERDGAQILLAIVGITYEIGDSRRYFLPMTIHDSPTAERSTIALTGDSTSYRWVQDAINDGVFRDFLVEAGARLELGGERGAFAFDPWILDGLPFVLDETVQSAATTFEQSNSSIAYGDQVMAKLYRRLEVGQNIEVDLNRYLATEAGFASIPKLIASATYRGEIGEIPLMLVQQHVGDHRDTWTALTDLLRHRIGGSLEFVSSLGKVTGDMHVALASAPQHSPLCAEPIEISDVDGWKAAFRSSALETDWIVGERLNALPARSLQAAREYLDRPRDWNDVSTGFSELSGLFKTRIHGDYHLGQLLVTKDGRLLVVDFEGEPHRPASEREAKYSPLRDVAGMLRSLNYATGVVASSHDVQADAASRHWLEDWERQARLRFLDAYREAITPSPVPIAPSENSAFQRAIAVLEADKAFYEVRYELSSRPDWAWLPLDSLK